MNPGTPDNMIKEHVHIDTIRVGDLVEYEGHVRTVGSNHLKRGSFMGTSLFGDTFRLGTFPVIRCRYITPNKAA